MNILLGIGLVLLFCCVSSKVMYKFGMPTLVLFLGLGMFLGSDISGLIYFDNADLAEQICNVALVFIMFYGGFGLDWKKAKSTALPAGVLASLGVALTALFLGYLIHIIFGLTLVQGLILGSILGSTDAASIFSILNSHNLNLKNNLNYLLEIESGSNDPTAYMLTTIFIAIELAKSQNIFLTLIVQIVVAIILGLGIGKLGVYLINKINLEIDGLYSILLISIALLSYSITSALGGNGFLAVYFTGIVIGNSRIVHRFSMIKYFDGLTWLMQILLFITLGLLSFPSTMKEHLLDGVIVAFFMFFVVRPIVVFLILHFFKRYDFKQKILISWAGFRGAASIVFATYTLTANLDNADWYFNVVFVVALLSVVFQGTLFVPLAKKLDLVSDDVNNLTNFYAEDGTISAQLLEVDITPTSPALNKKIIDFDIPEEVLIIMIRRNNKIITPKGNTKLLLGDKILIGGPQKKLIALAKELENRKLNTSIDFEQEIEQI
ncbi:potassium/proton antiporter [Mycoplasma sp. P36-A1]|uniref:potassium/proton antiporter n=1 Tax=Mycoplasma sp. P36-A1 TaxID=3252900 RepID=UPI003C2F4801